MGPLVPWREDEEKLIRWRAAGDHKRQSTMRRRPRRKEGFARWDGDVKRGRIDETEATADELTKVDAVAKGGNDRGLGEGFGGVGDPKAETRTKRKLEFFFLYALRARGRKRGQCRPRRWGRHLHGSPVRAQKSADGESEPN